MCIYDVCWNSLSVSRPLAAFPAPPHGTFASLLRSSQRPPRSDLDLRRSRLLATTAVAHLLKPANSHGRAIMNSWLVPAQTGVSAVNLRKPTSTPHLARQRLSRETHTPEPPAGVTGARAQRACYGAKCELCTCACGHTVHSGTGCIFSPIPENHLYRLLAFRWEDSKLQFTLRPGLVRVNKERTH